MSTQKIPNSQKQIIQSNKGDYAGNLWSTFNIDLDSNRGTIKTSKRLKRVLDSDLSNWADGDIVQALQIHDGFYYVATNDGIFQCSVTNDPTDSANWSDTGNILTEDLGLETDITSFQGLLLVSLGTDILSWDGATKNNDWWTTIASGTALTVNKTHILSVLRTAKDTLFITDGNKIRYYNTDTGSTIITLDTLMAANTFAPSLDKMWVGTYTEVENNAFVYEVAVGNDLASQAYEVDGRVCLTMFTYKNTPFVITEKGYIQAFNGAGFETVAQFPWADQSMVMQGCRAGLVQDSPTSRAIHPKGAQVSGKYAFIYVDTEDEFDSAQNLSTRGASGVWVLDLETYSLTHRYSLTDASTDYGSSKVERSGPLLITGTPETRVMVGAQVGDFKGVWMEGVETAQSYFTTVRHESESISDVFETFVVKADTLDTDETINVKYKETIQPHLAHRVNDISWLSATQFTTTDALTYVEVGNEVEIIAGYRAGYMCHITSIEGGLTKTVTVDESLGVFNELSDIYIDNWKKLEDEYISTDGERKKLGGGDNATFRQYKVVANGAVTVRETISKSNSKNEL